MSPGDANGQQGSEDWLPAGLDLRGLSAPLEPPAAARPELDDAPSPGHEPRPGATPDPGLNPPGDELRRAEERARAAEERARRAEGRARTAEQEAGAAVHRAQRAEGELARRGEQDVASERAPAQAAASSAAVGESDDDDNGRLDLNRVTFETLREVGLSVNQAARFIGQRDQRRGFSSVADVDRVVGIPQEVKDTLKEQGTV